MSQGFYGFPNILGLLRATTFKATGKAGATNGAALAGGTASGAPTAPAGPFDVGDVIVDATGKLWACTTAGTSQSSPGSFTQVGGTTSPLSTKGDLWVYGSADTRLGVGSDAYVLTADSTQTLGLKWAASGAGSSTLAGDSDVSISSPSAGQLLEYNGTAWANYTVPAVRCYNSGTISTTTGVAKTLTYDSNRFDQGTGTAQHSTSSNTSRLVCQKAGVYQITACVEWAGNATGVRDLWLQVNGATAICEVDQSPMGGSAFMQSVTTLYQLAVSDYVEALVVQTSGGNLSVVASANESPEFMMVRVA